MTLFLVPPYLIALVGLVVGIGAGLGVGTARRTKVSPWDARVSMPLLLGAAGAHLALLGAVEPLRQVLFGLYGLALFGVVAFAAMGWSIWRLGGVIFPAGSIATYFYFAIPEHHADYVGVLIKLVEVIAMVAVLLPLVPEHRRRRMVVP